MAPKITGRGRGVAATRPTARVPSVDPTGPARKRALRTELAGAREPYLDPLLYDWEYRRRTGDVRFYRMLADEQGGPIADLGCGTGRVLVPLLRDGHRVVGVDRAATMLRRAEQRVARAGRAVQGRGLLVRGDLRALPLGEPGGSALGAGFPFMLSAFHTIQHLVEDRDLLAFFREVGRLLAPTGWLAFDVFVPHPDWLGRPPNRRFDHTIFRHPVSGIRTEYSVSHALDRDRNALHMRFHYRALDPEPAHHAARPSAPVRSRGQSSSEGRGMTRTIRLCHRQLDPAAVDALTDAAGLRVLSRWASFEGLPLDPTDPHATEQHIYLVGRKSPGAAAREVRKKPAKRGGTRTRLAARKEAAHRRVFLDSPGATDTIPGLPAQFSDGGPPNG